MRACAWASRGAAARGCPTSWSSPTARVRATKCTGSRASGVLLVGAGGLGSPLGLYLAAAGVGTIGLVDADVVDESNLQRQILYATADVGRPKVEAAAERLRALNPDITVTGHAVRLSS